MSALQDILRRAKLHKKRIVLPEWQDQRVILAAETITKQGIAEIIIIGSTEKIKEVNKEVDLSGVTICDPENSHLAEVYAKSLYELRKAKGMTMEQATELIKKPIYFGTMMVKLGDADGMVAGAATTTADVWKPVLQIIKTLPDTKVASSCFIMELPNCKYTDNGTLIFADCALNPNPTAEQLASIAISTANTAKTLLNMEPRVAMLSFSTKGSAKHELVDKVIEATRLVKHMNKDIIVDGELQLDAALDTDVARKKCPTSLVGGNANILVFPDLQAANIGYKLVERLAGACAIGPISQGLAKPVNDLSRGCSMGDIVNVVAITAVEAQNTKGDIE